jgi:F-type H+-transporting ATPase subunit c
MIRLNLLLVLLLFIVAIITMPVIYAQEKISQPNITDKQTEGGYRLGYLAAGIGAGITVIGAGMGIGKLAGAAMEAIGRQPAAGDSVRTSMLIAAALIEGATFFALAICIVLATK